MNNKNRDDPYARLANAVIKQAVKDYRRARRDLLHNRRDADAKQTYKETLDFFRSDWFRVLCDLDAEDLIHRLDDKIDRL